MGDRAYRTVKADGTQWVPHLERALTVLLTKNFQLIVLHFEHAVEARDSTKDMQGRSQNYLKKLTYLSNTLTNLCIALHCIAFCCIALFLIVLYC